MKVSYTPIDQILRAIKDDRYLSYSMALLGTIKNNATGVKLRAKTSIGINM